MEIHDHRLWFTETLPCEVRLSPNFSGPIDPRYLVIHYTANCDLAAAAAWLCNPKARASAHLVIDKIGEILQLVPFDRMAWHCGVSAWKGLQGLNAYSIGIELVNAGKLRTGAGKYFTWFNREIRDAEVVQYGGDPWHRFTELQIETAFAVAKFLCGIYELEEVLGHEEIAPGRKIDPGPAFPMARFKALI